MDRFAAAGPAALLEREHEVQRVAAALHAVTQRHGGTLIIEGVAGMGKSRLLAAACDHAAELGVRVLRARATELEQGFPFGVMRQLLERPLLEAADDERERWLAGAAALAESVLTAAPGSAARPVVSPDDGGYAWQHGLYWLASNLSVDGPLALVVDDLQWCDAASARALAFIARRLDGQALALILATRPLDPALSPEAAALVTDPAAELVRPQPLTGDAIRALVGARCAQEPGDRLVRAFLDATGGNPFLVGELLDEAVARGLDATADAGLDIGAIVPRGVANAVLMRLARLPESAATLARALAVLDDGALLGDAARLAQLGDADVESATAALVSAGVVESGGTVRFTHPMLRAAIYGDLSPAQRNRLHATAASVMRERDAPANLIAAHVMHTEPAADPGAVVVLRDAARDALSLGDALEAATLLGRAMSEPPATAERPAVLLELGQALARAGSPDAVAPLSEVVEHGTEEAAIAAAAVELSGMLFFAGRPAEAAAVLGQAQHRLAPGGAARERLEVARLGATYTSSSARREADAAIAALRDTGAPARTTFEATTLATLAMDEVMFLRSAERAIDLAQRALAVDLPLEPHRGENWVILALAALSTADEIDVALRGVDEILGRARRRGSALTVATMLSLRAIVAQRGGDLRAARADAEAALELAPELLVPEFIVLAVGGAVLAGLDCGETPASLRRLMDRTGMWFKTEFLPSAHLLYVSGVLHAAAGDHEAAVEELRACDFDHPTFGGANPAVLAWRSMAALSLAELGQLDAARELADDELRRARAFGAPRAIGVALRAHALVGPRDEQAERLEQARAVLASSPARLEHARVLIDLGATRRAAGQRTAAREPLLDGLALAARCGADGLERRARTELAAIGVRPRGTDRTGTASLTPSERRVVELAAGGDMNREIAQTLFVTEKTVETHLGRAYRKLNVSSRRQLTDALARDEQSHASV